MMVLTTTKSISRVFRLTSGEAEWQRTGNNFAETSGQRRPDEDMLREEEEEGQIVLVNISVIFISFSITEDTHFHVSDLIDACKNCTLLTTPYRSTTLSYYCIIDLHISKMAVVQGH